VKRFEPTFNLIPWGRRKFLFRPPRPQDLEHTHDYLVTVWIPNQEDSEELTRMMVHFRQVEGSRGRAVKRFCREVLQK
jgi:hypothetical protein